MFEQRYPKTADNDGYEEISVATGAWSSLTEASAQKASAAILSNHSADERLYLQLTGGSPDSGDLGIIIPPGESFWLGNADSVISARLRAGGASAITVSVQYYSNNPEL